MNCPSCKEDKVLILSERMGIEIDYCSECRGVWLDRGELNKIIKRSQLELSNKEILTNENIRDIMFLESYTKIKKDFKTKKSKSFLEELFG